MQRTAEVIEKNVRIKELRLALKLTQTEFGQLFSASKQLVSDLESGRQPLTAKNASILESKVRNLNIDWLLNGMGEMFLAESNQAELIEKYKPSKEAQLVRELESELEKLRAQLGEKDKTISNLSNAIEALSEALKKIK